MHSTHCRVNAGPCCVQAGQTRHPEADLGDPNPLLGDTLMGPVASCVADREGASDLTPMSGETSSRGWRTLRAPSATTNDRRAAEISAIGSSACTASPLTSGFWTRDLALADRVLESATA
jgi:hypothetical protein